MSSEKLTIKEFREILPDVSKEKLESLFDIFGVMERDVAIEIWEIVKDYHAREIIGEK